MEKNLQLKEQLALKELNKKEIDVYNFKLKIILNENNDGSFNLQFRLLKKPKSLLTHLEPNMNICYSSLDSRNIRNKKEYYECEKIVYKIIESWKKNNIDSDEIVPEAELYLKSNLKDKKHIAKLSINSDLKVGTYQFHFLINDDKHKLIVDKNNYKYRLIVDKKNDKTKTLFNFEIIEMSGKEFINLGYIDYDDLKKFAFKNIKNKKTKRIILKINGLKTYKFFYFDDKHSYATLDNCRISSKHSRTPLNSNFKNKKIMIIGVGAIGSHVAELIASFWPSKIIIWDGDFNFSNSSTRQNYSYYNDPFPKCELLKLRLYKYKGVDVIAVNSNFPEIKNISSPHELPEKVDYIIDCTGKGIIVSEFEEISNYATDETIIISGYILYKLFIKICDFKTLKNDGPKKIWHKYDIDNNNKYGSNITYKGCSQFIEYSYPDVYLISAHLVSSIFKYKGTGYEFKEINSLGQKN